MNGITKYLRSKTVLGYALIGAGYLVKTKVHNEAGDYIIAAGLGLAGIAHKSNKDETVAAASGAEL